MALPQTRAHRLEELEVAVEVAHEVRWRHGTRVRDQDAALTTLALLTSPVQVNAHLNKEVERLSLELDTIKAEREGYEQRVGLLATRIGRRPCA